MPSGLCTSTSSALAVAGTTVTSKPAVARQRRMLALGAVVDGDHFELRRGLLAVAAAELPRRFVPVIGLAAGHVLGEVHAVEAGPALGFGDQRRDVEHAVFRMHDDAVRRTAVADPLGERPGVDAGDGGQLMRAQPGIEMLGRAPVRGLRNVGGQHRAARRRRHGLDIFRIGAGIADMREGEGDDLPGVRGIGHDLLIAGHRGVEADLAPPPCLPAPRPRPLMTVPSARTSSAGRLRGVVDRLAHAGSSLV